MKRRRLVSVSDHALELILCPRHSGTLFSSLLRRGVLIMICALMTEEEAVTRRNLRMLKLLPAPSPAPLLFLSDMSASIDRSQSHQFLSFMMSIPFLPRSH
ncbi:hypothetical protein AcV5_001951 [Taiwanofungus camphoratus]|nr:hypothetical protein AcV5_001951 [Antrodia cinnamomea]KAI0960709.1 hypothetical protein AcV7_000013 [Antrodia cinnamomea]